MLHIIFYLFSSCHIFVGLFTLGGDTFINLYVSCFNCLLIYIYELFIDICLYCVLFEIKKLICLLVLFSHMRLCILFSVSRNIWVDSIELLSPLAIDG